ncbi:HYDIN protein, partial [Vidua chalybeata]|nr:HYDIN protein [Vidua chalybeata]
SPFFVVPATGTLGAGDSMQVTVGFHALTNSTAKTPLCFVPGEERIHTKLHGEAVDLNLGLSTSSVEVEKTFITMSNHTTVFIQNRSNITAHFQWKTFLDEEDENEVKRRLLPAESISALQAQGRAGSLTKPSSAARARAQGRSVRVLAVSTGSSYCRQGLPRHVVPGEGEIGPHCSAEIKVTFKPLEALKYQSMAYCNISGRESRMTLRLKGEGQGPLLEFSCPSLNLGKILVDTLHVSEVKLINQGALDAPFTYIPSTRKGFCFKFAPEEGIIAPGGIQTIQISFNATVLGMFEEEIQVSVAGSPTPAILTIR